MAGTHLLDLRQLSARPWYVLVDVISPVGSEGCCAHGDRGWRFTKIFCSATGLPDGEPGLSPFPRRSEIKCRRDARLAGREQGLQTYGRIRTGAWCRHLEICERPILFPEPRLCLARFVNDRLITHAPAYRATVSPEKGCESPVARMAGTASSMCSTRTRHGSKRESIMRPSLFAARSPSRSSSGRDVHVRALLSVCVPPPLELPDSCPFSGDTAAQPCGVDGPECGV